MVKVSSVYSGMIRRKRLSAPVWMIRFCILLPPIVSWAIPGAVSAQVDSTPAADAAPGFSSEQLVDDQLLRDDDSLQLRLLGLETERLRLQSGRSNLLHRLIPAVHLSASFGWKDLIVLDPATLAPANLPKDAYRITIGISLSEILDDSKHAEAELTLRRVEALSGRIVARRRRSNMDLAERLKKLSVETGAILEQRGIVQDEVRFDEIRFRQGKIEYDVLLKSQLRLIDLQTKLKLLGLEAGELRHRLSPDGAP